MSDHENKKIREMLRSTNNFSDRDLDEISSELKYLERQKKYSKPKRKKSKLDKLWTILIPLLGISVWYFVLRKI